jgi:heat-inducible transcriptional repressor
MVDKRRGAVLRAVVQQYIETSQPVSSSSIANRSEVSASSATVRNEMAALEREGFLQQPHTSAGRVPTDSGYRYFVDQLGRERALGDVAQTDIKKFFDQASGEIEGMLHETGRLLTNITGVASVVVGPENNDTAKVRSAQIVPLSERMGLAVVVLSDGTVQKSSVELPPETSDADVQAASQKLAGRLMGKGFAEFSESMLGDANAPASDGLADRAVMALTVDRKQDLGEKVFVGGASKLASSFEAVEVVRNVLTILEQQYVVVTLIRDLLDRGVSVSIGNENNVVPLSQCSVVVAPTYVDGVQQGSIAVLGPTRMDYSQAISAVAVVSKNLGERLGEVQR